MYNELAPKIAEVVKEAIGQNIVCPYLLQVKNSLAAQSFISAADDISGSFLYSKFNKERKKHDYCIV